MSNERLEAVVIIGTTSIFPHGALWYSPLGKHLQNIRTTASYSSNMALIEDYSEQRVVSLLENRYLAPYARIMILGHGAPVKGELYVDLGDLTPISSVFELFTSRAHAPLIFDVQSCFSGNAVSSLQYLSEGSVLVTHTRLNAVGSLMHGIRGAEETVLAMQREGYNPVVPGNFTFTAATSLSVTAKLSKKGITVKFDPTLKQALVPELLKQQVQVYADGIKVLQHALCGWEVFSKESTPVFLCKQPPARFAITANTFTLPTLASQYLMTYHLDAVRNPDKTRLVKVVNMFKAIWEWGSVCVNNPEYGWTEFFTSQKVFSKIDEDTKADFLIQSLSYI